MYRFIRAALRLAGARTVRVTPHHWVHVEELHGIVLGGGADIDPARYGQPNRLPSREHERSSGDGLLKVPSPISWGRPREKFRAVLSASMTARAMALDVAHEPHQGSELVSVDTEPAPSSEEQRRTSSEWTQPSRVSMPGLPLSRQARSELGVGSAPVDRLRDALEFDLLSAALTRGLPILGICRGLQLINVHFGGTLHQDVLQLVPASRHRFTLLPRVRLELVGSSRLGQLLGPGVQRVNRLHRQAVDRLGSGLAVAARDSSGLVQAIEVEGRPFCCGVQWHPEYLPYVRTQRRLFHALVKEARNAIVPKSDW